MNWDSIKNMYEPQISAQMSGQQLFSVLKNMTASLKDGHTSLFSEIDFRVFFKTIYSYFFLFFPEKFF